MNEFMKNPSNLQPRVSLLVSDPEQPQEDRVKLAVNPDASVAQQGETLLRHVPAVSHPELRQAPAVFPHRAHTWSMVIIMLMLVVLHFPKEGTNLPRM